MSNPTFANEAPRYWNKNLPVIPLHERQKRPAINAWQTFADAMPTAEQRESWLLDHSQGNIGLPLGPQSGLVALDIDTDDPKILFALDQVMPKSPWERIGKKGKMLVFKYNSEHTFRIKDEDGSMICELLSKGTQIVLPPSIHPDTQRPYTANVDLLDVLSIVPGLPSGIESIIRGALIDAGIKVNVSGKAKVATFVPAGARDNALVSVAGLQSRGIIRGERTLVEALGEMKGWVENFTEQVVGDDVSVEKAQMKLVEFLVRDVTGGKSLPTGWDSGLTDEDKEKFGLSFTAEDERWSAERIIMFLVSELERHVKSDSPGWRQAVEVGLSKIARNPELTALEEAQITRFISNQSKAMPLTALRKRLLELRKGDLHGETHAEIASAVLTDLNKFGEVRFDGGSFWQWNGANWQATEAESIIKLIVEHFGQYPASKRRSDHKGICDTIATLARKPISDHSGRGLNFANGFLTEDLELVPHRPEQGSCYLLPYRYVPDSAEDMPIFRKLLQDCWGADPDFNEKIAALQEAMGATIFGVATRYQRVICLLGQPESGKSRIIEVLKGLMPPSIQCTISPEDWGDRFLPAEMFGKLLNYCGELSESRYIRGDIFKTIVEGAEITAQRKNQQPFAFKPACANWFASNHPPKTYDTSDGFTRRWLFLNFDRRIAVEHQIRDIDRIILEHEREAIAAWAVQGMKRLRENGHYTESASHLRTLNEMANHNNSVRHFLSSDTRLTVGKEKHRAPAESWSTVTALHEAYWRFCIAAGVSKKVTWNNFVPALRLLAPAFGFEVATRTLPNGSLEPFCKYVTVKK